MGKLKTKFYMKYFLQIVLLLIMVIAHRSAACQIIEPLASRVGEAAEKHAANDNFSGSILLAKNGRPVYRKTFGFADRERKRLFEAKTPSTVASIGKLFTSVLIMKLAEEGKLAVTDPISKFLMPQTKIPNADRITIHQLLTHTAGLANYMPHPDYATLRTKKFAADEPITLDDLLAIVARQPLAFETPGARHQYSNSNYIVLGKIIESLTGKKYADVLDEKILKPLKMKNTLYEINRGTFQNLAQGYVKPNPTDEWRTDAMTKPIPAPDGGIFTTADDLLKFDRALFGGKLVRRETFELMKKSSVEAFQPGLGKTLYGYGLIILEYENGAYSVGHNGGWVGYNAEYSHYFVGKDEYAVIIISNSERRTRPLWSQIQTEILKDGKTNRKP
jgi:CubicO group peptidase (beta-lactamase class C family)